MKFDVIVGNPPYQGAKSESASDKGKPPTIWPLFVELSNSLLKKDGTMIMVHPAMYRKPGNNLQRILYHNNRELHMYNNPEGIRTFGANTRYDWYVIDKTYTGPTQLYFEDGTQESVMLPVEFVPNGSWSIWQKVQALAKQHGFIDTIKHTDPVTPNSPFKVVQTITKTKGVVLEQSTKQPRHLGVSKVILSETGTCALYDKEGRYGTSCNCYYVVTFSDKEAEALVRFVESDLCWHLTQSCKWSNFRTEYCLWRYIPNPVALGITKDSTEQDIYDCFGLTADEVNHVNFEYGNCRWTSQA